MIPGASSGGIILGGYGRARFFKPQAGTSRHPPRPEGVVLLCWQRQCGAGCHSLNGFFQPRHTADLASISFPNGRS